jgi:transposase
VPAIARRGTRYGTGLGTYRWVVERTFAWLHGSRRLRIRLMAAGITFRVISEEDY